MYPGFSFASIKAMIELTKKEYRKLTELKNLVGKLFIIFMDAPLCEQEDRMTHLLICLFESYHNLKGD